MTRSCILSAKSAINRLNGPDETMVEPVRQDEHSQSKSQGLPRIVILGAGFGGLACARALQGAAAEITLVDQRNFHLFQPLLYQVATAALSPAGYCYPDPKDFAESGQYKSSARPCRGD